MTILANSLICNYANMLVLYYKNCIKYYNIVYFSYIDKIFEFS
jgi:hypothetical protein